MSKLIKMRFFLKDEAGKFYRIASAANPKDGKGEYYLKLMFPDLKGVPLRTGLHDKGALVKEGEPLSGGIQEFSYHYHAGISHFKDANGHVDSKQGLASLIDIPALHLLRLMVFRIDTFEQHEESDIDAGDFVIPVAFDGKPRGFEFAISRVAGEWNITNEQGKETPRTYKFSLEEKNVFVHLADSHWERPPVAGADSRFEIFRFENPSEPFNFIPQE